MSLVYSRYYDEVESLIAAAERVLGEFDSDPATDHLRPMLARARTQTLPNTPLRLAVVGEFSAGKSSLIAALTGASLHISADVATTAPQEFPWHGLVLVDTPGVHSEHDEVDHDRIARTATSDADLVLFVVTNELFSQRLADHLQYVVGRSGLGLAGKTAVVVNKIDRETNPDEIITCEVQKVLDPYLDVPVYLCASAKFLHAKDASETLRIRFERQSRMGRLVAALDQFVASTGAIGRLLTPLQTVEQIADALETWTLTSENDRNEVELTRRQRVRIQQLQKRLCDIQDTGKQQVFSTVMAQANDAVQKIDENTTGEDLESLFDAGLKLAVAQIEHIYDDTARDIMESVSSTQSDLESIGETPLGRSVGQVRIERAQRGTVGFSEKPPETIELFATIRRLAGQPVHEGLEAAAANAKGLRDAVYKAGKRLNFKFRPWQATKSGTRLAQIAGKAGKAFPFLATAFDAYVEYRREQVKDQKARYLARMRLALRNAFADQARVESEAIERGIQAFAGTTVVEGLVTLDDRAASISAAASKRSAIAAEIGTIRKRCTQLRAQLTGATPGSEVSLDAPITG